MGKQIVLSHELLTPITMGSHKTTLRQICVHNYLSSSPLAQSVNTYAKYFGHKQIFAIIACISNVNYT